MKIKPIVIPTTTKVRIPNAPPSQQFKDKSKYNRKKKHKNKDE